MPKRQRQSHLVRPERDREVFKLLHAIEGRTAKELAGKAGISPSTITKWRLGPKLGGTRFPQHYTMARVARAIGLKYDLVPISEPARPSAEHRASLN